jgi:putative endonuclease
MIIFSILVKIQASVFKRVVKKNGGNMAMHLELGQRGEELAVEWLIKNEYRILHRNWRFGQDEIDMIAAKPRPNDRFNRGDFLHFIEVKTRSYSKFGKPEDAVSRSKFKRLQRISNQFLKMNPAYKWIQYDIIAITIFTNKEPEIFFIPDVYL